jgi:hypothetical protein
MPRTITPPNALLKREAVTPDKLINKYGCRNLTEFARYCKLDGATMRRVYTRQINPGQKFITAIMNATGLKYDTLFNRITQPVTVTVPGDDDYDQGDWPIGNVRPAP